MLFGTAGLTGLMIGAAGLPVATPVVLGSSWVALGLGLLVGVAACAVALGSGLGLRKAARRGTAVAGPSSRLVSDGAVRR